MKQQKYKRLDHAQRYQIAVMFEAGKTMTEIAHKLGVNKSTISRELKRNTPQRGRNAKIYDASRAQIKTEQRKVRNRPFASFSEAMKRYMRCRMKEDRWSPELISAMGKQELGDFVSHETIYQYLWKAKYSHQREFLQDKKLYQYLRHSRRRRKRGQYHGNRGCIPNRVGIENRPAVTNRRARLGDLEVDIMIGANRKPGLLITVDRKSLETTMTKLSSKKSWYIAQKLVSRLYQNGKYCTLTFDNDLAFADHTYVAECLGAKTYFTRPYSSQDKGTVENRIGQIRAFIPKGTSIEQMHPKTIKAIETKINHRPVRKFNYLSALEYRNKLLKTVALAT